MSEDSAEINDTQIDEDQTPLSKVEETNAREQDSLPLVAATLIPNEPIVVVQEAEAVHDSVTVAAAEILDNRSGYVDSTCIAVLPMTTTRACFMSRETSSMSSYTTAAEEIASRQDIQELVQIDAPEDCSGTSNPEDISDYTHEKLHSQAERCCRIYVAIALFVFMAGTTGLAVVILRVNLQPNLLPVGPPSLLPPTPAPVAGIPSSADTSKPSVSIMPSCSGSYTQVSSARVAQSGSNHFTMSDDGNTIVVANHDYQLSRSFLETFSLRGPADDVVRTEATEGYAITDMRVSGDGSRLIVGVNSYPQAETGDEFGGAMLQLERIVYSAERISDWRVRHRILTGGGFVGSVLSVTSSWDGTTVAFVSDLSDRYQVEVYREGVLSGELQRLGLPMNDTLFNANTAVELSGDGSRLFIATSDGQVKAHAFNTELNDWYQLADTMTYSGGITPDMHASFNGTVIALGSQSLFPVAVFEERALDDEMDHGWLKVATLDIATTSQAQHFALSGDGRNIVIGEKFSNQPAVARLFRRSGSVFVQVQDMVLQEGIFRGMVLNEGGEQLVVAIDESVTSYRKDCAGTN